MDYMSISLIQKIREKKWINKKIKKSGDFIRKAQKSGNKKSRNL